MTEEKVARCPLCKEVSRFSGFACHGCREDITDYQEMIDTGEVEEPRPIRTREESEQHRFLVVLWHSIIYHENEVARTGATTRDALEGLAFSILSAIDGEGIAVNGYVMRPIDDDGNVREDMDISRGSLHEKFHDVGRENGLIK